MRHAAPLALLLALAACDASAPTGPEDEPFPEEPVPEEPATPVTRGAGLPSEVGGTFRVGIWPASGTRLDLLPGPDEADMAMYATSLWLTGEQDGVVRFTGNAAKLRPTLDYCVPTDDPPNGAYYLRSGVDYDLGDWPVEQGAPLAADGRPRVYGDVMAWASTCSDAYAGPDPFAPARTLRDVRINEAVFQHRAPGLEWVRFFRYEVTNLGRVPITDLRAGFYSDPDVTGSWYGSNLVGGTDRYATVYLRSDSAGVRPAGAVLGLGILELPKASRLEARRVIYRDGGPRESGFDPAIPLSDYGLRASPDAPAFAMRGLDDDGDPILDPTTGQAATIMYPGDPVAGTGWLDGMLPYGEPGWDVRVLQATDAFELAPGETVVLTAVAVPAVGSDLEAGLAGLEALYDRVAGDPSLWRFPVASE